MWYCWPAIFAPDRLAVVGPYEADGPAVKFIEDSCRRESPPEFQRLSALSRFALWGLLLDGLSADVSQDQARLAQHGRKNVKDQNLPSRLGWNLATKLSPSRRTGITMPGTKKRESLHMQILSAPL